jgi:hypothetical protein
VRRVALIPVERIERSILMIRGHKVILDKDLAILYGVSTSNTIKTFKASLRLFDS